MKSLILAAALLPLPSLAFAQAAAPAGQDSFEMSCALFHHNADGSWNAVQAMTLQPAEGPIPLKPSFKFKAGTQFAGFDLAAQLDKACQH